MFHTAKKSFADVDPLKAGLFVVGLVLVALTAWINIGFMAVDDYANHLPLMFPVGDQLDPKSVAALGIHPPLPKLFFMGLASLGTLLGIESPIQCFRFALLFIGLFSFLINAISSARHFSGRQSQLAVGLVSFFFLSPLMMSRLMAESVTMPLLTLCSLFLVQYWHRGWVWDLVLAVGVWGIAFAFRPQVLSILPVFAILIVLRKQLKDGLWFAVALVIVMGVLGAIDVALGRVFFQSYWDYVILNLRHSGENHGVMPFYVFILALLGCTLPPTFISRYRGFQWKEKFQPLLPSLLLLLFFLGAHSFIGHKEERFMVPILGVFLVCLVPLADYLISVEKSRLRIIYFIALNGILLFLTSFNIVQNNIVGLAAHLDKHGEFTEVIQVDESLVVFPMELVSHPVKLHAVKNENLKSVKPLRGTLLVVREDLKSTIPDEWRPHAAFRPGLLERIVIALNPSHNLRRTTLETFVPKDDKDHHP